MSRLLTDPPEGLHVLSLLLRERLEAALRTPEGRGHAARLQGSVGIVADGLETRLRFSRDEIVLDQQGAAQADVRASGSLAAIVGVGLGHIGLGQFLRGRIRVAGKARLLRRLIPLLQAPRTHDAHRS